MIIRVEFISYYNKDFKQIIPCDGMEDAEKLKNQLEKLRHVSDVRITTDITVKDNWESFERRTEET